MVHFRFGRIRLPNTCESALKTIIPYILQNSQNKGHKALSVLHASMRLMLLKRKGFCCARMVYGVLNESRTDKYI